MSSDDKPVVIVGSANPDKVKELNSLLSDFFVVQPRPEEMPETIEDGETLEFNALKKAKEVSAFTGQAALADDTGLFVDALDGRPGVYSARYAGENVSYQDNVKKLLKELSPYPKLEQRKARFETVIALVQNGLQPILVSGVVHGHIALQQSGVEGFGYDPVFVPEGAEYRSFAQMSKEEKNNYSHRADAINNLISALN